LEVYDASDSLIYGQWFTTSICADLDCTVSPAETANLVNGGYRWRVQTYGSTGYGPFTDFMTFTLEVAEVSLLAPNGTLSTWNNVFSWTGIGNADFYRLEVYDASDTLLFGQWFTTSICTDLDCAVSPTETANLVNGDYRWRVQTYGASGFSPYTEFMTFTLSIPTVILISPNGTLSNWNNTFTWTGIGNADFYQLEVYDASDVQLYSQWFTTSICTDLDCVVSPLETQNLANGDYKWRVRTYGASGFSPYTEFLIFTVSIP
jgi:hypothetical protein